MVSREDLNLEGGGPKILEFNLKSLRQYEHANTPEFDLKSIRQLEHANNLTKNIRIWRYEEFNCKMLSKILTVGKYRFRVNNKDTRAGIFKQIFVQ